MNKLSKKEQDRQLSCYKKEFAKTLAALDSICNDAVQIMGYPLDNTQIQDIVWDYLTGGLSQKNMREFIRRAVNEQLLHQK